MADEVKENSEEQSQLENLKLEETPELTPQDVLNRIQQPGFYELRSLKDLIPTASAAPTYTPLKFYDQFRFYNGVLYGYDPGTEAWVIIGLPSQTGNATKFLQTDGSSASWQFVTSSNEFVNNGNQSSSVTLNLGSSNKHMVTLTGSPVALTLANVTVGQVFIIRIVQDGTGSRLVTWFSTIKWPGNVAPTLTTTASKIDVFGFVCVSSGNYDGFVLGQNL